MATPTTQGRTPPQSGRIAQQAPASTVVLQSYEDTAFPTIAFTNQLAVNLTQKSLVYFDANGNWQQVVGGGEVATYYSEVAPTGVGQTGSRWFNSATLMWYSWNPTYGAWMAGDLAYGELAPTNPVVGQAWFNTHTQALTYFNGTSWVPGTDPTAPGVYSGAMPAAANAGSAWTDADGVVWGCDTTYTGGTGAGKWSRWAYRVDPLAKLILANSNRDAIATGESTASPPTPDLIWSAWTLGMIWLDTQSGSNQGNFYIWDGLAWKRVYAPNTIDLCLAIVATQIRRTKFFNTDRAICSADGATVSIVLNRVPIVGSEHAYWRGLGLESIDWSRTDYVLTIPAQAYFKAGDNFWVDYACDPTTARLGPVVTSPTAGSTLTATTPTFAGTGAEGRTVNVLVDGSSIGSTTIPVGSSSWSFTPGSSVGNGAHSVVAQQVEPDGTLLNSAPVSFTIAKPAYLTVMASLNPLWYGRLNEPSGLVMADSSGNSRNGTYSNGYTLGFAGIIPSMTDTCVDWSGATPSTSTAGVTSASWMNVSTIGLVAWINMDAGGDLIARDHLVNGRLWRLTVGTAAQFIFWLSGGGGPYFVNGATTLTPGTTYMLAATYDGTTAKLYVNGVLDGSTTQAGTLPTPGAAVNLTIADSNDGSGGNPAGAFNGRMQGPAVFSSLTAANIADLWTAGQP